MHISAKMHPMLQTSTDVEYFLHDTHFRSYLIENADQCIEHIE